MKQVKTKAKRVLTQFKLTDFLKETSPINFMKLRVAFEVDEVFKEH